jgi:hypothetical protein
MIQLNLDDPVAEEINNENNRKESPEQSKFIDKRITDISLGKKVHKLKF